ncbi:MAG: conjugal transfer protein TraH, partial [Syntrophales bacterium]
VSLMNFQYLVQKLQGILASAATVAFDMALKVLCPICSETLKSVEAIANQLNSAGLDSCKAGKAIVSYAADKIDDAFVTDQDVSEGINDEDLFIILLSSYKIPTLSASFLFMDFLRCRVCQLYVEHKYHFPYGR